MIRPYETFRYEYYRCIGDPPEVIKEREVRIYFPPVNLSIFDGQGGDQVGSGWIIDPDRLEETRGAFTVANLNDTDADGILDVNDAAVIATPQGENEKDLMKLVLHEPLNYFEEDTGTLRIDSGSIAIYSSATKGA